MARRRDDDYEDDDYEDRPRSRRRDDDDDYDDAPRSRGGEKGPLDKMYADTNIVVLILFGCCCNGIATILSLIAYLTAKDPKAKSNALIVLIIGGVITVLGIVAQIAGGVMGGFQQGGGR